jgi:hypothetical protein
MDKDQKHVPVIVLMDRATSSDHSEIRQWFEKSRFLTCEAANVFDALEQLSDFTIPTRPDVVLVDVDCCEDDLPIARNIAELPVMTISNEKKARGSAAYFHADLGKMASQLNELIPQ